MKKELKVGDKASRSKMFTDDDVKRFAEVSTDKNPIHLDAEYAKNTIFKQRIVHGMLVGSLFSGILGCDLPGEGTIYLGQTLSFKAPVPLNEQVTATVEVLSIREDKPIAIFKTTCVDSQGKVVIEGEATVRVP
jgi:3-hydroxybutyryl-CoA dehydratase/enoyl-CoA hydratase